MPSNLEKFRDLLRELFQLDQADLDFGIYRIMNTKRDEILRFLDKDLLPQVKEAFTEYQSADKSVLQAQINEAVKQAEGLGADAEQLPKVKELRQKLATGAVDITALENTVFSHLFNFFRRYYQDGDFISLRRYKEGVYAIPYEGEEVKLYWANHDQYYIKSSESFRDYTFKLDSGKRVNMRIVAASTEQNNNKEAPGKERRFILCPENPLSEENDELHIRFEYRSSEGREKQSDINGQAIAAILNAKGFEAWTAQLGKSAPTENDSARTVLAKHLAKFTARNEFDYFIHKDLGGFLRRELDFYIKNEVMHLDDIENDSVPRVEQYLSLIRVIRKIAHKIIAFLEQLENFQKKLWLKKKFVIETHYCITLDRIPEELYAEIAANDAQREEWVKLFAIDEINAEKLGEVAYSKPLTVEFLKAQPHLVLDTKHFLETFKQKLLASIHDLDEKLNGVLIHSENSQALQLIEDRYYKQVDCAYTDPPYNTAASEILYKNGYRHSSWVSMISDRIAQAYKSLRDAAILCIAIDDFELPNLVGCLTDCFGEESHLATVPVRSNPHGRAMASGFSPNHEYALFFSKSSRSIVGRLPRNEKRQARYPENDTLGPFAWMNLRKTGAGSARTDRPKLFYPVFVSSQGTVNIPMMSWSEERQEWVPDASQASDEKVVLPLDDDATERVWNLGWERARNESQINLEAKMVGGQWQIYRKYRPNEEGALPGTWWDDAKYSATESGTRTVKDLFGDREGFSYPKSLFLVEDCLRAANCPRHAVSLDFFGGSGTTAHAVINLNREDDGNRKYILIEMGEYFHTVLLPRVKKVVYSKDWKDGKPTARDTGISHAFKYLRLESYEDALANLELSRTPQQADLLNSDSGVREQYMLSYMLDVESRGSQSLLNIQSFRNPDQYKLKVERNGETQLANVDLPETFNWLLGLTVKHIDVIRGVRVIDGKNPKGDRVLVLWRNMDEMDNDKLDQWFQKQNYNTRELEYDIFYVNGDNNLENLRRPDQTWKVRLIEEEFKRLMFDVQDV
ncbi:MAG: site-specific DNA-methyltransferase [Phycisphaerae bacterium]